MRTRRGRPAPLMIVGNVMKPKSETPPQDLAGILESAESSRRGFGRWIVLLLLVVAGAGAYYYWRGSGRTETKVERYATEAIRRGNIERDVTATGNLQPTNEVTIGSELSGITAEVYVDVNDRVTEGQPLALIEVRGLLQRIGSNRASLNAARASVKQAEASLSESRASLARLTELHELSGGKMPSKADLVAAEASVARAEADLGVAEASVEQAQAQLDISEEEQHKATLRSPIDGVVLTRSVEPGQTVAASFTAPELFLIAEDLSQMKLDVAVAEADIGLVETGQSAVFTVDAWPNRNYRATVSRVSYGSAITDNVVTYETELLISNDDLSLRPGMTATADIRVASREDVLLVPDAALRFDPAQAQAPPAAAPKRSFLENLLPRTPGRRRSGGSPGMGKGGPADGAAARKRRSEGPAIWILRDGEPVSLPVTTGLSEAGYTEVSGEGVEEGLRVVVRANVPAAAP